MFILYMFVCVCVCVQLILVVFGIGLYCVKLEYKNLVVYVSTITHFFE